MSYDPQTMSEQEVNERLNVLLERAGFVLNDIRESNRAMDKTMKEMDVELDKLHKQIDETLPRLAELEQQASDDLDTLIIETAEKVTE